MPVDWTKRLEEAKRARDAAKAAITEDDRAEMAMRAELDQIESERREAERERAELDLRRRLEAAQELLGPAAKLSTHILDPENTFVIRYAGAKAHNAWEKKLEESLSNKKIDRGEVRREYAMASIYDWNGHTELHGLASEHGLALLTLMKEYPGLATAIMVKVSELAGAAMEDRKS